MNTNKLNGQYEVLNPWAEVDPMPLRGISPRVTELTGTGKTVGLFANNFKIASRPILTAVEQKLRDRYPSLKFSWLVFDHNLRITETDDKARFEEWVKSIDTAVTAVGD